MENPLAGKLQGKEVLLGVTGGIAAYKSVELVRMLQRSGANVSVVMTESAAKFVGPITFSAISGRPVHTSVFEESGPISHIELTARANIFVIAPATANIIGKSAHGIADDLISTLFLAAKCPVLFAPAMNCRMYDNPAVKDNLGILKSRGVRFIGPEEGQMACSEYGWGRMSEPADVCVAVEGILFRPQLLTGKKVLVTAGPTIEDLDPVRFIGNRSTGRMGYAVAAEAAAMGAEVTLISGPTELAAPAVMNFISVRSASGMEKAVAAAAPCSDIVVMAAAVADYAPAGYSEQKIKKGEGALTLELVRTPDILKGLGERKPKGQVLVGFAAETENIEVNALRKLDEKKLDLVAANFVGGGEGFAGTQNRLLIYGKDGLVVDTGLILKEDAGRALLERAAQLL
ncbi:MAG TPA: bifunctional phosphopantothenoylcysteine decarboxylase/phosphopantothenate--cysteine ligase CoaBC [Nitrospirota bacterium]